MKLRPSRLPSSSTVEANGTSNQNDMKNDDAMKTKLGSLWRKAKIEALSLSPRGKAREHCLPTNTTLAPVVAAEEDFKETNSRNIATSSLNGDEISSPRIKSKQSRRVDDDCTDCTTLKHRLPKKHSLTEPSAMNSSEPCAMEIPPVKVNAPTQEKKVTSGRPPVHSHHSTNSSQRSASFSAKPPTSPPADSTKSPNPSPKVNSPYSSCSEASRSSNKKYLSPTNQNCSKPKQNERALSAASATHSREGESPNPSSKIHCKSSLGRRTSRTKKHLSPINNQHANHLMQGERAVSDSSNAGSIAIAKTGTGRKKKKSALQQFREEEAAKALESARIKEGIKEIETKQRLEDEKNRRWWLLEGLGAGIVNGVACRTQVEQIEGDQDNIILTPKVSKAEGDPENKILTPKASNATPRNKKTDLLTEGEISDEGFEVTKKSKPKSKADKITKQTTKAGVASASSCANFDVEQALGCKDTPPVQKRPASTDGVKLLNPLQPAPAKKSKNIDSEHALRSSNTVLKDQNEVKKQSASTIGVKTLTACEKSRNSTSSQKEVAPAQRSDRTTAPKGSTNMTSDKQLPSKTAKEKSPDSSPAQTQRVTQGTSNSACASKDASEQRKTGKSSVQKLKSKCSSSKLVSQKKEKSIAKASSLSPETAVNAKETFQATMSPEDGKNLKRRQKLSINSLTENETDANFPDTDAYTSPRYACFGSQAIVPDATSEECEAVFPLTLNPIDKVGGELVREASSTIGKVLKIDPNQVKMNIERMMLTPRSAARMNIDRVVVTENVNPSHKCLLGGVANWFRDRGVSDGGKNQAQKIDSSLGDIQEDDYDLYPLSPASPPSGLCNASSCYDIIRFREEFAMDDEREFVIRNIASIFSTDRETIDEPSLDDKSDEYESDCEARDDSDADFEEDLEDCLGDETEEEFEEELEEEFGLDEDTTFGENTVESGEEDGEDFQTESETEDSESEFFTFDEEEYTDSETDLDSRSASESSSVSKSVNGSEEERYITIGCGKQRKDGTSTQSSKLESKTLLPTKLHPTPVIVNSPISEDQHRSIGGTSTFESSCSASDRKPPPKNLFSTLFKRSVSRVDKRSNQDEKFIAGSIAANNSFKSFTQSEEISDEHQRADFPPQVLCTTPPLTSTLLRKDVSRDVSEIKRTPSLSSSRRAKNGGESSDSDANASTININTSTNSSVLTTLDKISPDLDKIEVSFSIASDVDQAPDFSQAVSIVTAQEVLEMEGGHKVEHTSFELIFDQVTSVSISTSLENGEGENAINNQEVVETSTSEPVDQPFAAENPSAAESHIRSMDEVSADLEMEGSSTPCYVNTDGHSQENQLDASLRDVDASGRSQESRQDATFRAPIDSFHRDVSSEQREDEVQQKEAESKVNTLVNDTSFDCICINSEPSTYSKKSDALSPAEGRADVNIPTMSKVFPRRKSRKMASFFMGRSQSKPDKLPFVVDNE